MKKISLIILASIFLTACSGLRTDPPHNLDNACSIKKERKSWYRSMVRAERRWGVPVPVMMASIYQESRFTGTAKTPYQWKFKIIPMGRQSSAYGFAQALDGTWDEYREPSPHVADEQAIGGDKWPRRSGTVGQLESTPELNPQEDKSQGLPEVGQ